MKLPSTDACILNGAKATAIIRKMSVFDVHSVSSISSKKSTKTVSITFSLDFLGSDGKSSRFLADDDSLQRLTNTETHQYLRDLQRNSKSIPDYSNICGQVKVSDADDSEEKFDRFRVISGSRTKRGYHPWQATSK